MAKDHRVHVRNTTNKSLEVQLQRRDGKSASAVHELAPGKMLIFPDITMLGDDAIVLAIVGPK